MRVELLIFFIIITLSCNKSEKKVRQIEFITNTEKQDSIFNNLFKITNYGIPKEELNDSLMFLLLPIHASCPSCRKKTIDSIIKYKDNLLKRHYIIIAANGGYKTINSFFREEGSELPEICDKLFIDSTNQAFLFDLYAKNPAIYYTHKRKAYKKVIAIPATVKDDLREFFSGYRKRKKEA